MSGTASLDDIVEPKSGTASLEDIVDSPADKVSKVRASAPGKPPTVLPEDAATPVPKGRFTSPPATPAQAQADIEGPLGIKALSGYRGPGRIARGVSEAIPTSLEPSPSGKDVMKGASDIISGAGETLTLPMIAGGITQLPRAVAGIAAGTLAGKGAKAATKAVGGGPEAQDLAESLGFWAPTVFGSLVRPAGGVEVSPEGTKAAVTGFGGKAGAGVAVTPEGVTVRGKVGPFEGSKTFSRGGPAQPTLEPPTIEGQTATPPTPPVPQLPPDPSADLLVKSQQMKQQASQMIERMANGQPATPLPPAPPRVSDSPLAPQSVKNGQISGDDVAAFAKAVSQLPPDKRAQAIQEAHQTLSQVLLEQGQKGPVVLPDGKLALVKDQASAEKTALDLINSATETHEKALETVGEKAEEKPVAKAAPQASTPGRSRQRAAELAKPKIQTATLADIESDIHGHSRTSGTAHISDLTEGVESTDGKPASVEAGAANNVSSARPQPEATDDASLPIAALGKSESGVSTGSDRVPASSSGGNDGSPKPLSKGDTGDTVPLRPSEREAGVSVAGTGSPKALPKGVESTDEQQRGKIAGRQFSAQINPSANGEVSRGLEGTGGVQAPDANVSSGTPDDATEGANKVSGTSPAAQQPAQSSVTFAKGDKVVLVKDVEVNGKTIRAGTPAVINYAHPNKLLVRAITADGTKISRGVAAFKGVENENDNRSNGQQRSDTVTGRQISDQLQRGDRRGIENLESGGAGNGDANKPTSVSNPIRVSGEVENGIRQPVTDASNGRSERHEPASAGQSLSSAGSNVAGERPSGVSLPSEGREAPVPNGHADKVAGGEVSAANSGVSKPVQPVTSLSPEGEKAPSVKSGTSHIDQIEEIKNKIAELEAKKVPTPPVAHAGTTYQVRAKEVADRLRKSADALDKHIENGRRPMTQNPTPKRMAEYRSRVIDAEEMERTQKAMRALADAHEAGTISQDLAGLRSRDEIARLVHKGLDSSKGGYYDRIPRQDYYDKSPAGKKLQEMIEGAKSPEATAAKLAKEKASKISQLEADVQFRPLPGYFPTPKAVVLKMLDAADIQPGMSVLEPSAGKGNIADAIKEKEPEAKLSVVEQSPKLQEILKLKDHNLVDSDFLEHDHHYDRIVMNPPFEKGADVDHVRHAYDLLKPGGRLVAIMSPHAEFASDKKSADFRDWVESLGGESEKLPEGSFKESGTGVASRMVTIDKPESIESKASDIEQKSPLFRDTEANPQKGLFADESGEFVPGAIGEYLRDVKHNTDIARNLQRGLETLDTQKQADILRGKQTMEKLKLPHADDEAIYHHLENPDEAHLTPKQDDIMEREILPLQDANADLYTDLTKGGVPIENYVHRVVKGKGGMLDRIAKGVKAVGQKATLSKSAPQTKHRTYMALENAQGERKVVSIKGGQVTAWANGSPENLGGISHTQEGKAFEDKDGQIWNLKQATTKEIEANTGTTYYHSALASSIASNIQLNSAVRAMRFLEAFKSNPDFKEIAFEQDGKGNPPTGWKPITLPQFTGYSFEPRTAEVLDWYHDRMRQGNIGAMEQVGQFMRVAMLLNPIMHPMNVAASWAMEKGATGFLMPTTYARAWRAGNKAVKAVLSQNQDFLSALDAGAPLQSHREAVHDITKLFFDQLAEGLGKQESWAMRTAKALGIEHGNLLNILHKFSSKVAWMSNDIMFLQSAYEHQAQGMSLPDALKETGRIIPEYRVPTRILDSPSLSKLMTNKWATIFGSYHYSLLKSFGEVAKSALGAQEPPPGRSKAAEIGKGWDRLALLGLVTMALYPAMDELAKKLTGDKHAKVRRSGPFGLIDAATQVAQHTQSVSTAGQRIVTPAPQTKTAAELAFNREFYSGHEIYDPHASFETQTEQIGRYLLGELGQVGQVSKADTTEQKHRFMLGQIGVQIAKSKAEKMASDIAASKAGSEVESPEDHDNRVLRREILDQLRKGNTKPFDEAREKHELSDKQIESLKHRAKLTPLADMVRQFTYSDARKVYDAATPEERQGLERVMSEKRKNLRIHAGRGKEAVAVQE